MSKSAFLTVLDAMIARAEAACARLSVAAAEPKLSLQRSRKIRSDQEKMAAALTRLKDARDNQKP
jgi:hypothetical protein